MNCDEFGQRMHQRLDDRLTLDGDGALRRHAQECDSCSAELDAWRQIASVMPEGTWHERPNATRNYYFTVASSIAGLAAAILFALIVVMDDEGSHITTTQSGAIDDDKRVLAQTSGDLDPVLWWRNVQDRDWIGQTMPTVRSVQQSVAPIGRSLMRAVTILTIGGREQTS